MTVTGAALRCVLAARVGPALGVPVTTDDGEYRVHCHNLTHEDHDMLTEFCVGEDTLEDDPMKAAPATWDPES